MKYFFDHKDKIKQHLEKAEKILLLLDYDGTLTPIVAHPDLALLKPDMKKVMMGFLKSKKITLGIVSGRALKDVRRKVNIKGLFYAGNHGFEIEMPGKIFINPKVKPHLKTIRSIVKVLKPELKKIKGSWLEDKGFTISVHYRQCTEKNSKTLKTVLMKLLKPFMNKIRLTQGKKVWEIRPPIKWDKGKAQKWIINYHTSRYTPLPIYIGDDATDEDAFKALPDWGISILVGKKKGSSATYFVKNTAEVKKALVFLNNI